MSMSGDPNTAEVKINVVSGDGGSPADDMRDLADAMEHVNEQEEKYQKLLARRRQLVKDNAKVAQDLHEEGLEGGRVGDLTAHQRAERIVRRRRQKQEEQAVLEEYGYGPQAESPADRRRRHLRGRLMQAERKRWDSEMGLGPQPKKIETIEEEAQRRFHAQNARRQVNARIAELSGNGPAAAGWFDRLKGKFGGITEAMGIGGGGGGGGIGGLFRAALPGAGRFIGAGSSLALTALAAYGMTQTAAIASQQAKTGAPWMDTFNQEREQTSWIPGSGTFYDIKDLLSGRSQGVNRARRAKIIGDIQGEQGTRRFYELSSLYQQQTAARAGIGITRDNPLPLITDGRRETVGQRHAYELEQALLPARERSVEARRGELEAGAEYDSQAQAFHMRSIRIRSLQSALARENQITRTNPQGSEAYITAAANQARIQGQLAAAEGERKDFMRDTLVGAAKGKAGATYQRELAGIGEEQVRLSKLQEREGIASSQATRLGMMGPEGRLRGQLALEMIQRYGADNLPADIIAAASSVAPETVQRAAEAAGVRTGGGIRALAPEELRDDLPGIRATVTAAQNDVQKQKDAATVRFKEGLTQALTDAGLDGEEVGKLVAGAFTEMVQKMIDEAQTQSRVGGYMPTK